MLNENQRLTVEANLRLVTYAVNKYMRHSMLEYDDMISIGYIALCNAAEKYNPKSGTTFATYAVRAIVNNINRAILPFTRKKRGSEHVTLSLDTLMEANKNTYEATMGYEPDFSNALINKIAFEPVWKLCPTHRKLLFNNLNTRQLGKLEGVSSPAIVARRKREFEKARVYLHKIGIHDAYAEEAV